MATEIPVAPPPGHGKALPRSRDALATGSLAPPPLPPLPSAGKEPEAGSAASPLPQAKSLRDAFVSPARGDYAFQMRSRAAPGPPEGTQPPRVSLKRLPGLSEAVFSSRKSDQLQRQREGEARLRWQDLER